MIFNCNINIALVLIATTGSFAPTSFASEVPEASTRVLSWVVQTDEEKMTTRARRLQSTDPQCAIPNAALNYALITSGNAKVSAHTVYRAVHVAGALIDGTPTSDNVISSNYQNQASWVGALASPVKPAPGATLEIKGGYTEGGSGVLDFGAYEWLARNAISSTSGSYMVVVLTNGGTFNTYSFRNGGQGSDNGNTLVIFNTAEDIILDKTSDGRQFGPSVIAPFSKVTLKGQAGYVDGLVVAKEFTDDNDNPSSLQMHGNGYKGTITCSSTPAPTSSIATSSPTKAPTLAPTNMPTSFPTKAPTSAPVPSPVTTVTQAPIPAPVLVVTNPAPVTGAPVSIVSVVTPAPVPAPVAAPVTIVTVTPAPVPAPVVAPVTIVTITPAPVPAPISPGVNGDPIIMGLAGQIFKFEGRSGAWYSAASAKSFQWNMRTQKFEGCPVGSDTFLTGIGLTVFGTKKHQVEINVVNPYTVNAGCGNEANKIFDYGCLGAGSLELVIDGHKIVQSIDMPFDDNTGRVIAFNTIGKCSRRWFDFDITPREDRSLRHGKSGRNLDVMQGAGIFDVLGSTKDTAVDQDGCSAWITERKERNDILKQTGTFSTIVIKTEKISFHVEYHQEWERCSAHSLDIWISEVKPDVVEEQWEGVIGETKDLGYDNKKGEKRYMHREEALQFKNDEDYEVVSPYSTSCKACVPRND